MKTIQKSKSLLKSIIRPDARVKVPLDSPMLFDEWYRRPPEPSLRVSKLYGIYRDLYAQNRLDELSRHDHTRMLSVLSLHNSQKMASKAVEYVVENMEAASIELDGRDHALIMTIYLRAKRYDLVVDHFDEIKTRHNSRPTVRCFNLLMAAYSHQSLYRDVIATWSECVQCYPTLQFLNQDAWAFLIDSHSRAGLHVEAERNYLAFVARMGNTQIGVANVVHEAMVRVYGRMCRMDKAGPIFEVLVGREKETVLYSCDAVVQASFDADEVELAFWYLGRTENECRLVDAKKYRPGLLASPLPSTCGRVIEHYYILKDFENIVRVWDKWSSPRLEGDQIEMVCWALIGTGWRDDARRLYEKVFGAYVMSSDELQNEMEKNGAVEARKDGEMH